VASDAERPGAYRDERWKLIRYPQVNVTQLFDLRSDPFELHNLANDSAHAKRLAQMTARLQQQQQQFGDRLSLTVAKPLPAPFTPPTGAALEQIKARWNMR
jgi:arylsulfatase A-like enzyme